MRKILAVTALTALLLGALSPAASGRTTATDGDSALSPAVQTILASLSPTDMTTVVVTLRPRADLSAVRRSNRAARLQDTIRALRATADSSQAPIRARLRTQAALGRVARTAPLWVVNGISVTATAAVIRELATRSDVASIAADAITVVPAAGPAEPNLVTVGAPAAWDLGLTGQGVVVATLDSGVDLSHPDLASRWRGGTNSWFDPYGQHPTTPTDLSGHGTATTGVIVGGDAGGTSIGMAPGAQWIAARVFNDQGGATATAVHQAFQWVLDPDNDPSTADAPQVVNASWSIGTGPGCDLSFQPDVRALLAAGILPVFAAGNYGSGGSTSASPANYPESLAVGALNGNGLVFSASSRGPSTCGGRSGVFPDVVAPGVDIRTADRYGLYQVASGTSMSAPHAAGALTLLLSAFPGLSVERQRTALLGTATDLGPSGPDTAYGYGRLDVLAAYQWVVAGPDLSVTVAPAEASVTAGDSATYTVQVTPVNGFGADVPLSLSGAGQATWSFTPAVVPGGSGTSQLVVVTTSSTAPGAYPLTITASSGATIRSATATLAVTAPTGGDSSGPATTFPTLSPTPTNGSAAVTLHATGDDTATGGSAIAAAEYFVDTVGADSSGTAMTVNTPAPTADLNATIPATTVNALAEGAHTIAMHAQDAAGNWGPTTTIGLTVDKVRPALGALSVTPNPTQGATTATLSATATDAATAITRAEWFTGPDPGIGAATAMTITGTGPYTATSNPIAVAGWAEGTYTLTVRARDAAGNWSPTATTTLTVTAPVHLSTVGNTNPPGAGGTPDDADIYTWNGATYTRQFDATLAGLPGGANIDGYDRIDDTHFYLSFAATTTTVPGLGTVQDEDVVYYNNGTWSTYFDGTAHGLTTANHDLDAISIAGAVNGTGGTLYFSTLGNTNPPGLGGTADDADTYSWNGTTYTRIWDATANALPAAANVDGYVRIDAAHFYLSFAATTTTVPGLGAVQDEDITYYNNGTWSTYFNGTAHGLTTDTLDIDAFDTP
ncbi:S8 family serine peptidase [Cellulomonas sp. KRMCY2]|uniref:S8 family serine peptidase n=1 Tax=Cellulomonas sp. KRMCY2 TaxID=1304865 RepID=UPI00045E6A48|nr:S8 family serine peptidase [Cellulomonas sp. KRMCY2]